MAGALGSKGAFGMGTYDEPSDPKPFAHDAHEVFDAVFLVRGEVVLGHHPASDDSAVVV